MADDDDIRVHITSDDIEAACQAWLEAISEGHPVERVAARYQIWLRLSGVQARQTVDDLTTGDRHKRFPFAQAEGGSLA